MVMKKNWIIIIVLILVGVILYIIYRIIQQDSEDTYADTTGKQVSNGGFQGISPQKTHDKELPGLTKVPTEPVILINRRRVGKVLMRAKREGESWTFEPTTIKIAPGDVYGEFNPDMEVANYPPVIEWNVGNERYTMLRVFHPKDKNTYYIAMANATTKDKSDIEVIISDKVKTAKELASYLSGWVDEKDAEEIEKIIGNLSDKELTEISEIYRTMYGRELSEDIKDAIEGVGFGFLGETTLQDEYERVKSLEQK